MEQTFTIAQAGKLTGVTPYTLRYYERAGLIDNIRRDASGKRAYNAKDIEWITFFAAVQGHGHDHTRNAWFCRVKAWRHRDGTTEKGVFWNSTKHACASKLRSASTS